MLLFKAFQITSKNHIRKALQPWTDYSYKDCSSYPNLTGQPDFPASQPHNLALLNRPLPPRSASEIFLDISLQRVDWTPALLPVHFN